MDIFKKINELEISLPTGGMEWYANIPLVMSNIINKYPGTNIELTKKEFIGFMINFKEEVLVSLLLDSRKLSMNKILEEGFEFRGIIIRIR